MAIVAIGTSAGGLQALETVLGDLPASFPAPVVVVQHLDPDRRSRLTQILGRRIALGVRQVEDGDELGPGVHVAPPGQHLLVRAGGILRLEQPEDEHVDLARPSVDLLLKSIAEVFGDRSVAVVLTGTGDDGAVGAGVISQRGGTVIVQEGATAEFPSMPAATVATGVADLVVPLSDIGATLVDIAGSG